MYRRTRRSRLWYRKPRFLNRIATKKKGWLAPSIQHKLDSHIRLIDFIKKLLPIIKTMIEVAAFDIQKINNPSIQGVQYQQGVQSGFFNIREYVLYRDNHTCQKCNGKSRDKILQVHHIRGKAEGATDRPEELLTVCKTCHNKHHQGVDPIPIKAMKTFKAETFMNAVRWRLVNSLNCDYTYGYITKHNRIQQSLSKSHSNDAFVITGGINQQRSVIYQCKQIRRNNRKLQTNRKGFKPSIRRKRYELRPYSLVKYNNKIFEVKSMCSYGRYILLTDGQYIRADKVILYKYIMDWRLMQIDD